jgi:hypothetical protein
MIRLLLSIVLLAASPRAIAWGELGHRLVAHLAEQDLTPAARGEIAALLAGEPDPTLAGVSTWPDRLRAKDPGLGRRSAPWHYVNLGEDGCRYAARRDCRAGACIVAALDVQRAILRDRARTPEERRRALKFVVHFVGDVHQPLHAARAGDRGGSLAQVRVPTRTGERGSNLHAWWDSGMLAHTGADEAELLRRLRTLRPATDATDPRARNVAAWAEASCRIALSDGFYPDGARLPTGYAEAWTPVAMDQIRRAGDRLARILNAAFRR